MALARSSGGRSRAQGAVPPSWKSAHGRHSSDSVRGPLTPLSPPRAAAIPKAPLVQAALEVGEPDDAFEREADPIADEVMRMPEARPTERGAMPAPARLTGRVDAGRLPDLGHAPGEIIDTRGCAGAAPGTAGPRRTGAFGAGEASGG